MPLSTATPRVDPMAVLGGSGLENNYGFIVDDYIPELVGQNGVKTYTEMSTDPVIAAALYAISILLRGLSWKVAEADDTARAKEAKEFVEGVLFKDMSHSWPEFISDVMSMLPYGFAPFEIVWKTRKGPGNNPRTRSRFNDSRIGIRKLALRPQNTIWRWDQQLDGGISGFEQQLTIKGGTVYIPIEKALLFRTEMNKGNPEGRSILRGCYVPWLRKKTVEMAEGRSVLRSAGVAELKIPSRYMSATASPEEKIVLASYRTLAAKLAQDKQGAILLPSDKDENHNDLFSFRYVSTEGRRPNDATPVIERYDKRMAATMLADFILLGQSAVGSFALSSDKTQLFAESLEAHATTVASVINRFLLPRLWRMNNFDEEIMPELHQGGVSQRSLEELGSFIQKMGALGMPLFPDETLEDFLREFSGLPPASEETRARAEAEAEAKTQQTTANAQQAENAVNAPPEDDVEKLDGLEDF